MCRPALLDKLNCICGGTVPAACESDVQICLSAIAPLTRILPRQQTLLHPVPQHVLSSSSIKMPRPAKPPMTLKEAKRAYKKEGGSFRYTASQMARADRQDAREEKRQKELEKERQRQENKRKREDKIEKERNVKQKLLDDGRITVEDTWGKVTASQPRLNKFFGQKAVVTPGKSALREEVAVNAEITTKDAPATERQDTEIGPYQSQSAPQEEVLALVSPAEQNRGPLTKPSLSPRSKAYQRSSQSVRDEHVASTVQARLVSSTHSESRALKELTPSSINARSSASKKPLEDSKGSKLHKFVATSRSSQNAFTHGKTPPIKTAAHFRPDALESSESNTVSEGSPTKPVRPEAGLENIPLKENQEAPIRVSPAGGGQSHWESSAYKVSLEPSINADDDEDFTDGIDDETFLMMCATQKPLLRQVDAHEISSSRENSFCTTPGTRILDCPSREYEQSARAKSNHSLTATGPVVLTGLSESFTSVFNEIEDEDLIALVEEVEAKIATPIPTPALGLGSQSEKPKPRVQQPPPQLPGSASKTQSQHPKRTTTTAAVQKVAQPAQYPRLKASGNLTDLYMLSASRTPKDAKEITRQPAKVQMLPAPRLRTPQETASSPKIPVPKPSATSTTWARKPQGAVFKAPASSPTRVTTRGPRRALK